MICLVCDRTFHVETRECSQCRLPLIDDAAIPAVQRLQAGAAYVLVRRRYEAHLRSLDPPRILMRTPLRTLAPSVLVGFVRDLLSSLRDSAVRLVVIVREKVEA